VSRAKRRTPEEREAILRELEHGGRSMDFICKKYGVSAGTLRSWRSRDGVPPKLKAGRKSKANQPVTVATRPPDRCNSVATPGEDATPVIIVPTVTAPPPATQGQQVALLWVNNGLSYKAIGERVGVADTTVRRWLMNPGPVRDYVEELRAVQRRATVEHVAEVAYYGAKASAGAVRIAAEMVDDTREQAERVADPGAEPLTKERLAELEFLDQRRANAIMAAKSLGSLVTKAWEALDLGAINTVHTDAPAEVDELDAEIERLKAELAG